MDVHWTAIPGSQHDGGCGFSFADGHAEIRKWLSKTSRFPVQYFYPGTPAFDAAGRVDFAWWRQRTGFVNRFTGQLMSGDQAHTSEGSTFVSFVSLC